MDRVILLLCGFIRNGTVPLDVNPADVNCIYDIITGTIYNM